MRAHHILAVFILTCGLSCAGADQLAAPHGSATTLPATRPATQPSTGATSLEVLGSIGVNIHFTDPKPGEMKMIADAGCRWVRMDFGWGSTERAKGAYDFAAYDRLLAACDEQKIHALFILDYSNKLYDDGLSPHTDEGRAAFAKWSAAAAQHFKGRGILWEMYNEPNGGFWKPKADVDAYAKLALAVGKALHDAAPDETYIGPATSEIDFRFLEKCFQAGLLDYWSAVSVHPYRQRDPETAGAEYARLRRLIAKYAPKEKKIPIISGEWGYSAAWKYFDPERQGKYLPRELLINLYNEVPVSIWYDWHDDGTDPKEPEHHFGIVAHECHAGREPVYDPKPAYVAMKALTSSLGGLRYNKRLAVGDPAHDFVIVFDKGGRNENADDVRLAVWTTSTEPHVLKIAASPGDFRAVDYLGKEMPSLKAADGTLSVTANDSVQYLIPQQANKLLRLTAAAERVALDIVQPGGHQAWVSLEMHNPLDEPIGAIGSTTGPFEPHIFPIAPGESANIPCRGYLQRSTDPQPTPVRIEVRETGIIAQWTHLIAANPIAVSAFPPSGNTLVVRIDNLSNDPFEGMVFLTDLQGGRGAPGRRAALDTGEPTATVKFPFNSDPHAPYHLGIRLEDLDHNVTLKTTPQTYRAVDDFARFAAGKPVAGWQVVADGDAKVASEQTLNSAAPEAGPPAPGVGTLALHYHADAGHKFFRLSPQADDLKPIDGEPKALGVWINGDGHGALLRMRYTDSTGQTFQPDGGRITWTGWRHVIIPLDPHNIGHWGGAGDGTVHYPIKLDTLILLDNGSKQPIDGTIYVAAPVWTY